MAAAATAGAPERLHQSIAKLLVTECPAIARMAMDDGVTVTRSMRRGSLIDQLVFGGASYHVVDARLKSGPRKGELATDWTGVEAKKQRKAIEARGQIPVLEHELDRALQLAGRIKARLLEAGLDPNAWEAQRTIQWTSSMGVECEGTPDLIVPVRLCVDTVDLKVGENANPEHLDRHVFAQGWDVQAAAYAEAAGPRHRQHWICCADASTGIIGLYPLSETYMELGRLRWQRAQHIWQQCRANNEWPEYTSRALVPPRYVYEKEIGHGQ